MASIFDRPFSDAPRILPRALPEAEQPHADILSNLLEEDLGKSILRFSSALELFDYCNAQIDLIRAANPIRGSGGAIFAASEKYNIAKRPFEAWIDIAVREAGLTLGDFLKLTERINVARRKCPTLNKLVQEPEIDRAVTLLGKHFPGAEQIRNAFAHLFDLSSSIVRKASNEFTGTYNANSIAIAGSAMVNLRMDRKVIVTIYQMNLEFEVSQDSLDKLIEIRKVINSAFEPAALATQEMRRKQKDDLKKGQDQSGDGD